VRPRKDESTSWCCRRRWTGRRSYGGSATGYEVPLETSESQRQPDESGGLILASGQSGSSAESQRRLIDPGRIPGGGYLLTNRRGQHWAPTDVSFNPVLVRPVDVILIPNWWTVTVTQLAPHAILRGSVSFWCIWSSFEV
jgi:hypothetical protein